MMDGLSVVVFGVVSLLLLPESASLMLLRLEERVCGKEGGFGTRFWWELWSPDFSALWRRLCVIAMPVV